MNSRVKRTIKRALSTALTLAMLLTIVSIGLPALAAISNPSVSNALAAKGYTPGPAAQIDLHGDNTIIGTLNINELIADYPNLVIINVRDTNITNIVNTGSAPVTILSTGTFESGDRQLVPASSNISYSLTAGGGIDIATLVTALQPTNFNDGTAAASLISGVASCAIDGVTVTPGSGGTYGIIPDAALQALSLGNHTLELTFNFNNVTGSWNYMVSYSLDITDVSLTLTPSSSNVFQGGTATLTLKKYDEAGASVPAGTVGTNLSVNNPFSAATTLTYTNIGNDLQITVNIDSAEPIGLYTLSVTDGLSGKIASASLNVQALLGVGSLQLEEWNNSASGGSFTTADTMHIKGGTSISSGNQANIVSGTYNSGTIYRLSDGGSPLSELYCSVLTATDAAGNVVGEFISDGSGGAALRVVANPVGSGVSGTLTISSPLLAGSFSFGYTVLATNPVEYVLYMADSSVLLVPLPTVQEMIDSGSSGIQMIATYRHSNGWNPVSGSTAHVKEQKDALFVVAARYENGGAAFVIPYSTVTGWYDNIGGSPGPMFGSGTQIAFAGNNYVLGQSTSVNSGATLGLIVTPLLGSGGSTANAIVQVSDGSAGNTLYFDIQVEPRAIVGYEFRNGTTGAALNATDLTVPIGTSKNFQIYAIYDNGAEERVTDFTANPMTVSYGGATVFPAGTGINPGTLNAGGTMTVTATNNGGANDALSGTSAVVTVTDSSGKTGAVTLTLGNSLITGLTYYVETPGGILEYDSGGTQLQKVYSAAELASANSGVLEIPRGLNALVWAVPVFTNVGMYTANTASGDWRDYGVISGISVSSSAATGGSLTSPGSSGTALVMDTAGDLKIDIGDPITTTFDISTSVSVNGKVHGLAASNVTASLTVKIMEPVVVEMDVERWDEASAQYISIFSSASSSYELSGNVGDEFKLRVKVIYSDGSSVDDIGANVANTFANGVYFLPSDDVNTYDPSAGYGSYPSAGSFGAATSVGGLGVVHGYFMSRSPKLAGYFGLVNSGSTPTQAQWNNNMTDQYIQSILSGLTRQIQINRKTGTPGGVIADYLTKNGGDVPGHYSVKLIQTGGYTLDFNGLHNCNGYTNAKTEINGITSGNPLVINVTVSQPTIEKVYLVGEGISFVSAAAIPGDTDKYSFDKTHGNKFNVYPVLLDSSYYITHVGALPAVLTSGSIAGMQGVSKMTATDWSNIGAWSVSDSAKLYIEQKTDGSGYVYLEVTVLDINDIPASSPETISLALSLSATSGGAAKYSLTPPPADPTSMGISTSTNPLIQDIVIGGGYIDGFGGSTSVELNDSINFPVSYLESVLGIRPLNASEVPGSPGIINVLVVAPDPANPGACTVIYDHIANALKFTPGAIGTYTFTLSTENSNGDTIPTISQGSRIITFTVTPTSFSQTVYYGESISIVGLVTGATSYAETGTPSQLDTTHLTAGRLKMTSNVSGSTAVNVRDASGTVIATIQVTLNACDVSTALEPAALMVVTPGSWYTFAPGQSIQMQWRTEYTRPGTSIVTCVEYSNPTGMSAQGPDDFLTLSGGTLTANALGGTGPWYGIYTVLGSGTLSETIYVMMDDTIPVPTFTYELRDSNTGTYNVLTSISMSAGQMQTVYVFDVSGSPVQVSGFTASSSVPGTADVTNMGGYAQVNALLPGSATITFSPLQGGSVTLNVTVTAAASTTWAVGGRVRDAVTTAGVSGATVILLDAANTQIGTGTTNATGYYSFASVGNGTYTVSATAASGYVVPVSTGVTVSGANATAPDINLTLLTAPYATITLLSSIQVGSSATATVTANNFSGTLTYTWSSSAPGVATVSGASTSATATVNGIAAGSAIISCTVTDGTTTVTATAAITVTPSGGGGVGGGGGGGTTYTLTFDTNGGSAVSPIKKAVDSVIQLTQTSTKEGYIFTGWYSDAALANKVTSVTLTADKTVYAGWKAIVEGDAEEHFAYINGKGNGLFEPDAQMTRAEVAVIFARILQDGEFTGTYTNTFTDVSAGAWYANAVGFIQGKGLIKGYSDGTFRPDNKITRAEFAAIVSRFADVETEGTLHYNDVSENHWAYDYIKTITGSGWTNGYPDGSFRPDNNITRAEVVTIINRMLNRHADEAYIGSHIGSLITFRDVPSSHWAYFDIIEAANDHISVIDEAKELWID